jgi:hypothetical protein
MGMIGAIRFPRRDADEREVKGMPFAEIKGIGLATESDGNFLDDFGVLPSGRLALLCGNMSEINFFHDLTRKR